jgi:beta-N-acetylhexosaminidase
VNLNFAPVLDVVPPGTETVNEPIGALDREYGHSPAEVGSHGVAVLRGMTAAGAATSAKHFPGLGRVEGNTDFTADVVDTVTTADDQFLDPFRRAVRAGVPMVMVALATYTKIDPDHLAVFSSAVMRLLRDGLGFRGVIVSDDLGATSAVEGIAPADRAIGFLEAGGDLIIAKTVPSADPMAAAVLARSRQDPAFRALVDRAALRVLEAKQTSGLLACPG